LCSLHEEEHSWQPRRDEAASPNSPTTVEWSIVVCGCVAVARTVCGPIVMYANSGEAINRGDSVNTKGTVAGHLTDVTDNSSYVLTARHIVVGVGSGCIYFDKLNATKHIP
jgi:hypothetical protein